MFAFVVYMVLAISLIKVSYNMGLEEGKKKNDRK
jgi:hypothetical protein